MCRRGLYPRWAGWQCAAHGGVARHWSVNHQVVGCGSDRSSWLEQVVSASVARVSDMPGLNLSHMISFDLETTGTNPLEAKIVTSAVVTIRGREKTEQELLADPGIEIPQAASEVHGITTEYAREHGRPHDDVLAETLASLREGWAQGATLIVYNAAYDLSVLKALAPEFTIDGPVFDPLVVDRAKDPYRKGNRKLESVCAHYGVNLTNAHEATADAIAAARVAWKIAKAYPELLELNADELMMSQTTWHYEAQTSLQKYFDSKGRDITVNTEWPVYSRPSNGA